MAAEETTQEGEGGSPEANKEGQEEGQASVITKDDRNSGAAEGKKEEEVPVRRSPWNNRQERADFFKAKKQVEKNDEGEDGDEPLTFTKKQLESFVQEHVSKAISPIESSLQDRHDSSDLMEFFSSKDNERFRKYESTAKKFMKNQAYANVDLNLLFKGLAYDDAFAEGATRGTKADDRSARTRTSGTQSRSSGATAADKIKGMSDKDFQALRKGVMSGKERIE